MLKKFAQRIRLNFKHGRTERAANVSYSNYHNRVKRMIANVYPFKKLNK